MDNKLDFFVEEYGRQPRVLYVKWGGSQDSSEGNQLASALADRGFDVDVAYAVMSMTEVVSQALDNDDHAILLQAPTYIDEHELEELETELQTRGGKDLVVFTHREEGEYGHRSRSLLGAHMLQVSGGEPEVLAGLFLSFFLNEFEVLA